MPIDPLPSISRSDANFRTQVDDYFLTRLPAFSTQAESARGQIVAAESTTTSAASTAATAATTATTAAGTATSASASAVTAKNAAELAAAQAVSGNVATPINAATSKSTPADADELGITDSAASWGLKKLTFANLKTWLSGLYVGKTGAQAMVGSLSITGNVLVTGGGVLGYGVGSGGEATQATSKSTGVTLNKSNGRITMHPASLAAGASVEFEFSNVYLSISSGLLARPDGFAGYSVEVAYLATATSVVLRVTNKGATRSDALGIVFGVLSGATA